MKYLDEYRDKEYALFLVKAIKRRVTATRHIMEICGGQTHTIARYGLDELLLPEVRLLHGPGCPVCVTPEQAIDGAVELAQRPGVVVATFGDMMRVPGSRSDLLTAKAKGGDVRMMYSPLDAVALAEENRGKEIVFFAVGFETTIPVHLMALREARRRGITNFHLLTSLFTVPPAVNALLSEPECKVDGLLLAGHVCAVTGYARYRPLARKYRVPMVVAGFEPVDLLYGIYKCVNQLENGTYRVENGYKRAVSEEGNPKARLLMDEMLDPCDQPWRGIGLIPGSGLKLKDRYSASGFRLSLSVAGQSTAGAAGQSTAGGVCLAGAIMRGMKQVADCPHFGAACSPSHPLGAPMVSAEGVCAAYHKYKCTL